jgi:hypothetical protein
MRMRLQTNQNRQYAKERPLGLWMIDGLGAKLSGHLF